MPTPRETAIPLNSTNPKSKIQNLKSTSALLLLVLGVYLLTMSGHTYSPDEETMLQVSRNLVQRASWAMERDTTLVQVEGADGRLYSQYGPGQSLAAVPWVALGLAAGTLFPQDQAEFVLRLLVGTFNLLVGAGIAGLFAATGLKLGYGPRPSLFLGGALAFATYLWPHSRTFFSEPLVTLLLLASFYLVLRPTERSTAPLPETAAPAPPSRRAKAAMILSGALFAAALATKIQYIVALPAYLLYLFLIREQPGAQHSVLGTRYSVLVAWTGGLALGLLPLLLYNWAFFGNPLSTGYGTDLAATFRTPLYEGLFGLLFSPGKGLLWYAPPVALSLWGFAPFYRQHRAVALFIPALALPVLLLFSLYTFWHGDGSWGPRYLVPILPFLLLPALPLAQDATVEAKKAERGNQPKTMPSNVVKGQNSKLKTPSVLSTVVAVGFLVNVLGVLVNFDTYINLGYNDEARHYIPYASPIVGHWNLLGRRTVETVARVRPPERSIVLQSGFSYSEGDKTRGEMLPRWTTGAAAMTIQPRNRSEPISVTLRLTDHRPPEMPRANVSILVDGAPAAVSAAPVPDQPISTDYTFSVPASSTNLTINSDTWNPAQAGAGERDETIGVKLDRVQVSEGGQPQQYSVLELLPAPPYYPRPRWYYDPATPHPSDLWLTYMPETNMGRRAMLALGLPIIAVALACLFFGWRGLRQSERSL